VPGNQTADVAGVGRNHEMRGAIDREKFRVPQAFAEERICASHGRVTCPAANDEGGDSDCGQRCRQHSDEICAMRAVRTAQPVSVGSNIVGAFGVAIEVGLM
jgi:hypothetical protein